ncbi:hypothetical protein HYS30_03835 [Candidatus Peregrinibacteria bacterium]|nr:hypothetical protein [Candidatus Peregrinibacteria bacterium]
MAAISAGTATALLPTIVRLFPPIEKSMVSIIANFQPHVATLEPEHIAAVIARSYSIQNTALLLPAISLILAGMVLHPRAWNLLAVTKRQTTFAALAALSLLVVIFPAQLQAGKNSSTYATPTGVQQFLEQKGGLSLSFLPGSAMRSSLQMGAYKASLQEIQRAELSFLPANMNLFSMLPTADYYDRLGSKRMGRLLALVGTDRPSVAPEETLAMRPLNIEQKMEELRKRRYILDILNVRHIISGWPLEAVGFAKEFTEEVTDGRIPVSVYGNPSARPFAYFAKRVEFMEPDAEKAYSMLKNRTWNAEQTLIECTGCAGKKSFTTEGTIEITQQRPTFLEVQTFSSSPQWLVLSQNYLPGWKAQIDGKTIEPGLPTETGAKVGLAMSTFAAVPLPAGEHTITLTFSLKDLLTDSWSLVLRRDLGIWR